MSDSNRGLYQKYFVERVDGSSRPGSKHEKCKYFVLDLTHDRYAHSALAAYIIACQDEYPLLASDLLSWMRDASAPEENRMNDEIDLNDGLAALLRLKHACEIGDGIDQHCASDIEIAIDEIKRLRAIMFESTAPLDWREAKQP